ncbi:MAG: hypothetical protein ABIP75_19875 [Pyrinomonadaceae bacterium]
MKRIRTTEIYFELEESTSVSFRAATTGSFCPHCGAAIESNRVPFGMVSALSATQESIEPVIEDAPRGEQS